MEESRIYFLGNPWSEGHLLKTFKWTAKRLGNDVWFDLYLVTQRYYAEREAEDNPADDSDWAAPIVWNNFNKCTISSMDSPQGGFKVCALGDYSPAFVDGLVVQVDSGLSRIEESDDLAFSIYLLGHDAVACHEIQFVQKESGLFDIEWRGKIALTYVGESALDHGFVARIKNAPFPALV
jgi:hypothetical protein